MVIRFLWHDVIHWITATSYDKTKILAERLKQVLPSIIHNDQKGFVKGKNITEANRLLQDLIFYTDQNQINSAIIFLDYEKDFDRVEWSWTLKCLKQFNFVETFISWIDMVFKNAKTSILTNGFRSSYFEISRSMRQGCSVSPLHFILQAGLLACTVRTNINIRGIPLPLSWNGRSQNKCVCWWQPTFCINGRFYCRMF